LNQDYSGRVFFAQPQHKFDVNHGTLIPRARSWFRDTLKRSRWLYADAIAASLVINLIALAAPLFVMNVYDRVVPNQATATCGCWPSASAAPTCST
jgi:ATP-binding cassette subfamily C protein LapB